MGLRGITQGLVLGQGVSSSSDPSLLLLLLLLLIFPLVSNTSRMNSFKIFNQYESINHEEQVYNVNERPLFILRQEKSQHVCTGVNIYIIPRTNFSLVNKKKKKNPTYSCLLESTHDFADVETLLGGELSLRTWSYNGKS